MPEGNKIPAIVDEAWETIVAKLMDKGFPLIDYHVHLKGGLTLEQVRYKTPNAWMIRMAKNAGIKFTLGTNNNTKDLGNLDFCLKMVAECGLTADDIFMPKTLDKKPVMLKGLPKNVIK